MIIPFCTTGNSEAGSEPRRGSTFSIPRLRSAIALCTWGLRDRVEPERRFELRSTSLTLGITLKRVWSSALAKSRGSRARTIAFKETLLQLWNLFEVREHSLDLDPTYGGLKPSLM